MHGDQEILPEEEVEVGGLEIERVGRRLVEVDARHHHEDVAVVLFQLDAGARRKRVLDGEGVEFEHLLEQRVLVEVGTVDVDPQLALARASNPAETRRRSGRHPTMAASTAASRSRTYTSRARPGGRGTLNTLPTPRSSWAPVPGYQGYWCMDT